jgi:hypothetical protein
MLKAIQGQEHSAAGISGRYVRRTTLLRRPFTKDDEDQPRSP